MHLTCLWMCFGCVMVVRGGHGDGGGGRGVVMVPVVVIII